MFVPVFALVPWLGYQTFQKLQHFATQAQSEALRVLAQSLQPELDAVLRPQSHPGLRFVPEPMRREPVSMESSMNGRLLVMYWMMIGSRSSLASLMIRSRLRSRSMTRPDSIRSHYLDDLKQLPSMLSVCVYRVDLQAARFY